MKGTVLVTGASGGIGREIALHLAKAGFHIGVHFNSNEAKAALLCEEIEAMGQQALLVQGDLSSPADCKRVVSASGERGDLFGLVNNAGTTEDALLMRMEDHQYEKVMKANMDSCFYCTREVLPYLTKARKGRIVHIASVVGITGNAGQANYAASKAAMIGFGKSVAKEVGRRGVLVNTVAPGFIKTPMTDALPDNVKQGMLEQIPLKRFGEPSDIAGLVAFLFSDFASYITGQTFIVDGGMIM